MDRGLGRVAARLGLALIALSAGSIAAPSGASAGVGIGETFPPDSECAGGQTVMQLASPSNQYAAPSAGQITAWYFEAASPTAPIELKVGRSAGGVEWAIVADQPPVTPTPNTLNYFPVSGLPVLAGDVFGFYLSSSTGCLSPAGSGYGAGFLPIDVPPNPDVGYQFFSGPSSQLDLSLILEPDCDGDGRGDQTQDRKLSACGEKPPTCGGKFLTQVGTKRPDHIVGTAHRDVISTLGGNDRVSGLGGNDVICGGSGNDTIKGAGGNDRLIGGKGRDRLIGGRGRDRLDCTITDPRCS